MTTQDNSLSHEGRGSYSTFVNLNLAAGEKSLPDANPTSLNRRFRMPPIAGDILQCGLPVTREAVFVCAIGPGSMA